MKGEQVHVESEHEIELSDIEWLVQNPTVDDVLAYSSKDECKANQYFIYWGVRLNREDSKIKANKGDMCAILIDYDDGYTMDTFNEKYNGRFQYYIYTSISHTPEHHKFRVIIPTVKPFTMDRSMKAVLAKCFPASVKDKNDKKLVIEYGVDESTFDIRAFYEPVKINDNYSYFISNGPVFDVDKRLGGMLQREKEEYDAEIKRIEEQRKQRQMAREARGENPPDLEFQKTWTTNNLESKYGGCGARKTGHRYTDLKKYCTALLLAEYWSGEGYMLEPDEVEDIILNEYDDANIRSMVNGMIKTLGR